MKDVRLTIADLNNKYLNHQISQETLLAEIEFLGVLKTKDLNHNSYYEGISTNSSIAKWCSIDKKFFSCYYGYSGTKSIIMLNHPEDKKCLNIFYPTREIFNIDPFFIVKNA